MTMSNKLTEAEHFHLSQVIRWKHSGTFFKCTYRNSSEVLLVLIPQIKKLTKINQKIFFSRVPEIFLIPYMESSRMGQADGLNKA